MENRNIKIGIAWKLMFYIAILYNFIVAIFSESLTSIERIEKYVYIICILVIVSYFKYVEDGEW